MQTLGKYLLNAWMRRCTYIHSGKHWAEREQTSPPALLLPLGTCVTLGKSLDLFETQFSHLQNEMAE